MSNNQLVEALKQATDRYDAPLLSLEGGALKPHVFMALYSDRCGDGFSFRLHFYDAEGAKTAQRSIPLDKGDPVVIDETNSKLLLSDLPLATYVSNLDSNGGSTRLLAYGVAVQADSVLQVWGESEAGDNIIELAIPLSSVATLIGHITKEEAALFFTLAEAED